MLSRKKQGSNPLPDPAEFQISPLADDPEFRAAQAAVGDAEKAMFAAEQRHVAAQAPADERTAWRDVKNARAVLAAAGDRLAELASAKSFKACKALRPHQEQYLRELLDALDAAADAFGCLAGLQARIVTAGYELRSDVLGLALPPAIYQLGSSDDFGSQLAQFRRWLKSDGII
jgi:hypothetical protein